MFTMPRIRIPYTKAGRSIVLQNEDGDEEFTIDSDLYKALYAFSPTIVKLPSHIRLGPAAIKLLLEAEDAVVKEAFKAGSWLFFILLLILCSHAENTLLHYACRWMPTWWPMPLNHS